MATQELLDLSRRERQVLDIVYRLDAATASDIQRDLDDDTNYSAVRALLTTLAKKGFLTIERDGTRYVYHPTIPARTARTTALRHVIDTFFGGSPALAVSAMLDERNSRLSKADRLELLRKLRKAREEGR